MASNVANIPACIHLVGIGGAGMSGLAEYLLNSDRRVTGSDVRDSAEMRRVASLGSTVFRQHRASNIGEADLVVMSDAIPPDNLEVTEAHRRGLTVMRRAECLAKLGAGKKKIYVAGSHGKTTTAAMIAHVLACAGAGPDFIIGADVPCIGNRRAQAGMGGLLVAEACEAFQNLQFFRPDVAVITNIEDEHLEHYGSQAELDSAFREFARKAAAVVANGDDVGVRRVLSELGAESITSYGFGPSNDVSATSCSFDWDGSSFDLRVDETVAAMRVPVPGRHIISNALACFATCRHLGLSIEEIARGLSSFTGASRRWEDHGLVDGVRVIDDYAHHPTELKVTLDTARSLLAPKERLTVAFQPQLFSRTLRLTQELATVLAECDQVLLLEIDPGGEKRTADVGSRILADAIKARGGVVELFSDPDDLVERAPRRLLRPGILLVAGAGNIRGTAYRVCCALQLPAQPDDAQKHDAISSEQVRSSPAQAVGATWRAIIGRHPSVLDRFKRNVERLPYGRAVSDSFKAWTYQELDAASDAIAQRLAERGVICGSVVGVALPSSIDLVATAVALLKLGAIYLPLDDALPAERARFMLEQAQVKLVVTLSGSQLDRVFAGGSVEKIGFQELNSVGREKEVASRSSTLPRDRGAYICFTSGSTGYPKGVLIREGSLSALVADIVQLFRVDQQSKTVLNTSISFDVSLAEIWMTLCGGGELLATGSAKPLVGERLARFIVERAVTHLLVTPSVLASVESRDLPSLRCIVVAGEPCPQRLVDDWATGRQFFNAYGPTEATVYATAALCQAGEPVTIGRPLRNVATYILNEKRKQVVNGDVGELCLGGACLAAGYLGAKAAADEKFLKWGPLKRRIYHTGDLVRKQRDGNFEYLGRLDQQVKIRGNRIELGEIEQSITRLSYVEDAAVYLDDSHAKELIAFIVTKEGHSIDQAQVRETLAEWLPNYMLPSQFFEVAELPLTTTGKRDKQALLALFREAIAPRNFYEAPRNEVEAKLASIWKEALELESEIGVYDDFAFLGGDSLKSLLVIAAIEERFQLTLPPGFFGRFTTLTRMAVQVTELLWNHSPSQESGGGTGFQASRIYKQLRDLTSAWDGSRANEESLIVSVGAASAPCEFFVSIQTNEELQILKTHLGDCFRIHAMRSGHLVMEYTPENVEALASRYVEELEAMAPRGQLLIGGSCQGGIIAAAVASKLLASGRSIGPLILIEQGRLLPFDGEVVSIFTENSFQNPMKRNRSGTEEYERFYGGRWKLEFIPGEHASLFEQPSIPVLAAKLKALASRA